MALMSNKPGTKPDTAKKAARLAKLKEFKANRVKSVGHGFGGSTPNSGEGANHNSVKNRPWREALHKEIIQADPLTLRKLAKALIKKAASGDVQALKEIADRLDGRSVAQIEAKTEARVIVTTDDSKL